MVDVEAKEAGFGTDITQNWSIVCIMGRTSSVGKTPSKDIDRYLMSIEPERRAILKELRKTIHKVVPGVEECLSYGMPAFKLEGKVICGFLATKKGCSYYPFSGSTLKTLRKELTRFEQTKSALHFSAVNRLPVSLVRKLVSARLREIKQALLL